MSKQLATAKFDETIELVCRLGVDPRKAEEMVRGTVALPSGTGRNVRVAVFAQGEGHYKPKRLALTLSAIAIWRMKLKRETSILILP